MNAHIFYIKNSIERDTNHTESLNSAIEKFYEAYLISTTIIGNLLFLFLVFYHRRKTSESEKKEFEYHHAPIFSQLYYISAFCLFTTNFCFALTIIGNWSGNGTIYKLSVIFLVYIEILFTIFYNVVLGSIIMFSFLAAFQKIVILYIPSYKWSVTGLVYHLSLDTVQF